MRNIKETKQYIVGDYHKDLITEIEKQITLNNYKLEGDRIWSPYGSEIEDYEYYFRHVLRGEKIVDFIKNKPSIVAIDLMSPSITLENLFYMLPPDRPRLGIALSYCDNRTSIMKERDERMGIKQLSGDILEFETWEKIEETLNGKKADLIMERAIDGKNHIASDIRIHAALLKLIWNFTSFDNGVILLEMPHYGGYSNEIVVNGKRRKFIEWIELLKDTKIEVEYSPILWETIKIVKTPNSPQNLPFLE